MTDWRHYIDCSAAFAQLGDEPTRDDLRAAAVAVADVFDADPWVTKWLDRFDPDGELECDIHNLRMPEFITLWTGADDFDGLMAALYDWADANKVWIETRGGPVPTDAEVAARRRADREALIASISST